MTKLLAGLTTLAIAALLFFTLPETPAAVSGGSSSGVNIFAASNIADFAVSNRFYGLSRTSNNAALNADGFVFAGDSYCGEVGVVGGVGYGLEWPTWLLTQSNYCRALYAFNFGVAGYTTPNVSNTYSTTIGAAKPASGSTAYLFLQSGQNDSDGYMTNFWTNIIIRARIDGYKIVAFTAATNGRAATDQLIKNTNNLMIRASSSLYDYLVDFDTLMTNSATQLLNGHPTKAFNRQLAEYIGRTIVPTNSGVFQRLSSPPHSIAADFVVANSNLIANGGVSLSGPANYATGPGGLLSWDGTEIVITSSTDGATAGNAPTYIQTSTLNLNKGGMTIFTGPLVVGALGASITNIYATNSTIDFPSTIGITNFDSVLAIPGGCTSNDVAMVQAPPSVQLGRLLWSAFTSNNAAYIRCTNTSTNTAVDPPSALFNLLLFKR